MKNKIYYVSSEEMHDLKKKLRKKEDVFVVEIDGDFVQDKGEFLDIMTEEFKFPYSVTGFDGYLDWIRDLEWLKSEEYILIINNFGNFIKKDILLKKMIIEDIEEVVLPWWEKEVEDCMVEGKAKPFNVYLVD
ncbi:barstar family protein [Sebaldella sp. S0638]|uniref:barstar family protein n=1 Tax=Sebaldella sp. S0638 TaxID=2957809 RepID=UPI00209D9943|nr:barstar family protein [Sebaldella sp. S0638]MCP1225198.1 hypothetical protein [Sebaldella sp. S0638]